MAWAANRIDAGQCPQHLRIGRVEIHLAVAVHREAIHQPRVEPGVPIVRRPAHRPIALGRIQRQVPVRISPRKVGQLTFRTSDSSQIMLAGRFFAR